MKKRCLVLCVLALCFSLTACFASRPSTTENDADLSAPTAGQTKGDAIAPDGSAAPGAAEREEQVELEMMLEGMKESVPATLYMGEGYSLYIPDEGWRMDEPGEWEATANSDVELKVRYFAGKTEAEVRQTIVAEEDDYRFEQPDETGWLLGEDQEDRERMEIRLFPVENGTFAVFSKYPAEAIEGFGVRLRLIADTFRTE